MKLNPLHEKKSASVMWDLCIQILLGITTIVFMVLFIVYATRTAEEAEEVGGCAHYDHNGDHRACDATRTQDSTFQLERLCPEIALDASLSLWSPRGQFGWHRVYLHIL